MEYLQYVRKERSFRNDGRVLNLVISGIPSIPSWRSICRKKEEWVLNLVISGIPSILVVARYQKGIQPVLNLVISGIPSILGFLKKCNLYLEF